MNKVWWAKPAVCRPVSCSGGVRLCLAGRGRGRQAQRSSRAPGQRSRWPGPHRKRRGLPRGEVPLSSPGPGLQEQPRLRLKILEYLLGPLATLDAQRLRRDPAILGSEDDFDRLYDSLHDALELFPRPCSGSPKAWLCLTASAACSAQRPVSSWAPTLPAATSFPWPLASSCCKHSSRRTRNGWRASSRFWLGWTLRRRFPWARPDLALSRPQPTFSMVSQPPGPAPPWWSAWLDSPRNASSGSPACCADRPARESAVAAC